MVVETSPVDTAMETETLKLKRNWSPGKKPQEALHPIKKFEIQQWTVTPKYKSLSGHKTTNDDAKTRTRLHKYNSIAQKYAQDKAEAQGRLDDGTTPKKSFKELVPRDYWDFQDIFDPDKAKRLPRHTKWDMEINFVDEVQQKQKPLPRQPGLYESKSPQEKKLMEEFVKENLDKGWI